MNLIIDFTPEQEARLNAAAQHEGIAPAEVVKKLVDEHLPAIAKVEKEQDPLLALFDQWEKEDADMTPDEIAAENRQWEEFKANINAERDRAGARRIF
ncbi:MAG TPA: hypothetical protein VFA07_15465 [Chthonomonadaceae bacterium]|nr:hypothetical protein [Chthonomonadaceae bacterium]